MAGQCHTDQRVGLVEAVPEATDGLIASYSLRTARSMAEVESRAAPEGGSRQARPVAG
jgi:hypothetical protein